MKLVLKCIKPKPPWPFFRLLRFSSASSQNPWPLLESFIELCNQGDLQKAMAAMDNLHRHSVRADPITYSSLIKLCLRHRAVNEGRRVHRHLSADGDRPKLFLSNILLNMYFKFNLFDDARQLFDEMVERNVVSWTTMISALVNLKQYEEAIKNFVLMRREGVEPNMYTYSSVLGACLTLRMLWSVHCCIIKYGLELDVFVRSSLIDVYSKFGDMEYGYQVFSEMATRDLVVWNSIIGGFAQSEDGYKALELFMEMKRAGFLANQSTLTSTLRACTGMVMLEMGKQVHVHVLKHDRDLILNNALLDMYCKCGSLEEANTVFQQMWERDVISWSTMISGLAQNGRTMEALRLFDSMKTSGTKPNHITIVGVLFACSHAGLLDDAWYYFNSMERLFDVKPGREHYGCMVDLMGRAGKLEEALNFIDDMGFEPDSVIWRTLLGACRVHRNMNLAAHAAKEILKLEPSDEGTYILLSNIYADSRQWSEVEQVRKAMREQGVRKEPGRSWIDVGKKTHVFIVGNFLHPEMDSIGKELNRLIGKITDVGYVPDVKFVLHDLEREQKEELLRYHSEKLAIAFGMMKSMEGKLIRIMKNLRICGDCHNFAKLVAQVENKGIVIRDPVRFHHFQDGSCSCGDYW